MASKRFEYRPISAKIETVQKPYRLRPGNGRSVIMEEEIRRSTTPKGSESPQITPAFNPGQMTNPVAREAFSRDQLSQTGNEGTGLSDDEKVILRNQENQRAENQKRAQAQAKANEEASAEAMKLSKERRNIAFEGYADRTGRKYDKDEFGNLTFTESTEEFTRRKEAERKEKVASLTEDREKERKNRLELEQKQLEFQRDDPAIQPLKDADREKVAAQIDQNRRGIIGALGLDPTATDEELEARRSEQPNLFGELDRIKGSLAEDDEKRKKYDEISAKARETEAKLLGIIPDERLSPLQFAEKQAQLDEKAEGQKAAFEGLNAGYETANQEFQASLSSINQGLQEMRQKGATAQELSAYSRQAGMARMEAEAKHFESLRSLEEQRSILEEQDAELRVEMDLVTRQSEIMASGSNMDPEQPPEPAGVSTDGNSYVEKDGEIIREGEEPETVGKIETGSNGEKVLIAEGSEQAESLLRSPSRERPIYLGKQGDEPATDEDVEAIKARIGESRDQIEAKREKVYERVYGRVRAGEIDAKQGDIELQEGIKATIQGEVEIGRAMAKEANQALLDFSNGNLSAQQFQEIWKTAGMEGDAIETYKELEAEFAKEEALYQGIVERQKGKDAVQPPAYLPPEFKDETAFLKAYFSWKEDPTQKEPGGIRLFDDTRKMFESFEKERSEFDSTVRAELEKEGINGDRINEMLKSAAFEGFRGRIKTARDVQKETHVTDLIPFISGIHEAKTVYPAAMAALALQNGEEISEEQEAVLEDFIIEASRDMTAGAQIMSIWRDLPAFAGELWATGGLYTAGKKGTMKLATQALEAILKKKGANILARKTSDRFAKKALRWTGNMGIRAAGVTVGATLQSPFSGATRIPALMYKDMATRGFDTGKLSMTPADIGEFEILVNQGIPGPSIMESFAAAVGDNWAEVVSEHSGGAFTRIGDALMPTAMRGAVLRALKKLNGGKTMAQIGAFTKRAGWNGVIEEMLEERVGEVIRGGLDVASGGVIGEEWKLPTLKQVGIELAAFAVPGSAFGAINEGVSLTIQAPLKRQIKEGKARFESLSSTTNFDQVAKMAMKRFPDYDGPPIDGTQVKAGLGLFGGNFESLPTVRTIDRKIQQAEQGLQASREAADTDGVISHQRVLARLSKAKTEAAMSDVAAATMVNNSIEGTRLEIRNSVPNWDSMTPDEKVATMSPVNITSAAIKVGSGVPIDQLTSAEVKASTELPLDDGTFAIDASDSTAPIVTDAGRRIAIDTVGKELGEYFIPGTESEARARQTDAPSDGNRGDSGGESTVPNDSNVGAEEASNEDFDSDSGPSAGSDGTTNGTNAGGNGNASGKSKSGNVEVSINVPSGTQRTEVERLLQVEIVKTSGRSNEILDTDSVKMPDPDTGSVPDSETETGKEPGKGSGTESGTQSSGPDGSGSSSSESEEKEKSTGESGKGSVGTETPGGNDPGGSSGGTKQGGSGATGTGGSGKPGTRGGRRVGGNVDGRTKPNSKPEKVDSAGTSAEAKVFPDKGKGDKGKPKPEKTEVQSSERPDGGIPRIEDTGEDVLSAAGIAKVLSPIIKAIRSAGVTVKVTSGNSSVRASASHEEIHFNPKALAEDAVSSGLKPSQTIEWLNRVVSEELRHHSLRKVLFDRWSKMDPDRRTGGDNFNAFLHDYFTNIWNSEFRGTPLEGIVRKSYNRDADGNSIEDWQLAEEGLRMVSQQLSEGKVTEEVRGWLNNASESLIGFLKSAIEYIKKLIELGKLPDGIRENVELMESELGRILKKQTIEEISKDEVSPGGSTVAEFIDQKIAEGFTEIKGDELYNPTINATLKLTRGQLLYAKLTLVEDTGKTSDPKEVNAERKKVDTEPSQAKKEAGNYKKGHIKVHGLDVSIENPKGSIRWNFNTDILDEEIESSKFQLIPEALKLLKQARAIFDKKNNLVPKAFDKISEAVKLANKQQHAIAYRLDEELKKGWHSKMSHDYGDIKRTVGAEGNIGEGVDVFLGEELSSPWVYVVDQYDSSGKFDEHKVMLGFPADTDAGAEYAKNYEKGWKVGPVTTTDVAGFKRWLDEGDQAKPFREFAEEKNLQPNKKNTSHLDGIKTGDRIEWGTTSGTVTGIQPLLNGKRKLNVRRIDGKIVAVMESDKPRIANNTDTKSTNVDKKSTGVDPQKEPELTETDQEVKGILDSLFDDDAQAGALSDQNFSRGIPKQARAAILDIADKWISEGVNSPAALASKVNQLGDKYRVFTDALWSLLRVEDPSFEVVNEWASVYESLDTADSTESTQKNETDTESDRNTPEEESETGTGGSEQGSTEDSGDGGNVGDGVSDSTQKSGGKRGSSGGGKRPGKRGVSGGGKSTKADGSGNGKGSKGTGSTRRGKRDRLPEPTQSNVGRPNYVLTDPESIVGGGPKTRFKRNQAALELVDDLRLSQREPTTEELNTLSGYTGWGAFGQELFQGTWDRAIVKPGWEDENVWLRDHMGESSWKSAAQSILNSHYTDPPTVTEMWKMVERMGFNGGRVLEPSEAIGNFWSLMPERLRDVSAMTGVELDPSTFKIAEILHPRVNHRLMGYQESKTPDNFYDLVIGNWPFAADGPSDRRYNQLNPTLHDYFFFKALDQTRPGGIVIGITSSGTMDKKNAQARRYMASRGELIASYRLPTGAFGKYAGTKVVTDIIILRKREKPLEDPDSEGWINSQESEDGNFFYNEYYHNNPENILGTIKFGHGTTQGRAGMIVERHDDFEQVLPKLHERVPENAFIEWKPETPRARTIANTDAVRRQNSLVLENGDLYRVQGEQLELVNDIKKWKLKDDKNTEKRLEEFRGLISIRDAYDVMMATYSNGGNVSEKRKLLKKEYDSFIKSHKGGLRNSKRIQFMERMGDPGAYVLMNLEDENGKPSPVMDRDIMRPQIPSAAGSVRDAYAIQRNNNLTLDLDEIAKIAGVSFEDARDELVELNQVFQTPTGEWIGRDEYLSGNVRRKLREAQDAKQEGVEGLEKNIEALEEVQPPLTHYSEIEVRMGANWVDKDDYRDFIASILNIPNEKKTRVEVVKQASGWKIVVPPEYSRSELARNRWGINEIAFRSIIQGAMNGTSVTVKTTIIEDGKKRTITDEDATKRANSKIEDIRTEFESWIWKDQERTGRLAFEYNEALNSTVTPKRDGSHLRLEGLALTLGKGEFDFRKHQVDAVWRGVQDGRLMAFHEVGTGKTFTIAGIAMEGRRLGRFRKPILFAHNSNHATVAEEVRMAYPGAKVLHFDKIAKADRDSKLRQIALDDWDLVIVPHSLIDKFTLKEDSMMDLAKAQIQALEDEFWGEMEELGISGSDIDLDDIKSVNEALKRQPNVATAKELAKSRERIISRIQKKAAKLKEDAIFFEDIGVDAVMVDEAHSFKKISLATRKNIKGLNKTESGMGFSLTLLTDYVKKQNAGKGVFLFTGTPVTNSLNEVYNMMQYVMSDVMDDAGIKSFDDWFNTFADTSNEIELNSGGTYTPVERLLSFINVPELAQLASQHFDVVLAADMPEFVPRTSKDGMTDNPVGRPFRTMMPVTAEMSKQQSEHKEKIKARYNAFQNLKGIEKMRRILGGEDSPLMMETEGSNSSIDYRLVDMEAEDFEGSKLNMAVERIGTHFDEHEKSTQMVFLQQGWNDYADKDVPVRDGKGMIRKTPEGKKITNKVRVKRYNLVRDMVEKLVAKGVKPEEIAVFSDMKLDKIIDRPDDVLRKVNRVTAATGKEVLSSMMREGKIRIAFGSSESMGTGVNAQTYMRAMHHLDAPWMPGHLEQRNGRGWRQGNKWNTVIEYRYYTEGSHDARRWQILLNKARFILRFTEMLRNVGKTKGSQNRVLEGDGADTNEEGGIGDFEESFSAAAGDPRLLLRANLEKDVKRLEQKRDTHLRNQEEARRSIDRGESEVSRSNEAIRKYKIDSDAFAKLKEAPFSIDVRGDTFTERPAANNSLERLPALAKGEPQKVAQYGPFSIYRKTLNFGDEKYIVAPSGSQYGLGALSVDSIEGTLRSIVRKEEAAKQNVEEIKSNRSQLDELISKPFAREDDLERKKESLGKINAELAISPTPAPSWLRNGIPAGSVAYIKDEKGEMSEAIDVLAHRWDDNGYWVMVDIEGEMVPFKYDEVFDEDGNRLLPDYEFEKPPSSKEKKEPDAIDVESEVIPPAEAGPLTPELPEAATPAKMVKSMMDSGISMETIRDAGVIEKLKGRGKVTREQALEALGKTNPSQSNQLDAEYLRAVESGDMETAQRMVDESAKAAGYKVGPVYHGAAEIFTEFDINRIGSSQGIDDEAGFHFLDNSKMAEEYGQARPFYLSFGNSDYSEYDAFTPPIDNPMGDGDTENPITFWDVDLNGNLREDIEDGWTVKINGEINGERVTMWVSPSPSQIKSADPVTYDRNGNILPLSKRFDPESDNIAQAGRMEDESVNPDDLEAIQIAVEELINGTPNDQIEGLRKVAATEKEGERTVGGATADRANIGDTEQTRRDYDAVQETYRARLENSRQSQDEWQQEAERRIAEDRPGVTRHLLEKMNNPEKEGLFLEWEIKAAPIIINGLRREAYATGNQKLHDTANALSYGNKEARTLVARSMVAMRDNYKTPEERHLDFISQVIAHVPENEEARIRSSWTAADKSREIDRLKAKIKEAQENVIPDRIKALEKQLRETQAREDQTQLRAKLLAKRNAKIKKALRQGYGVTLNEIFNGEAVVRLRGSKIVQKVMTDNFTPAEAKAIRLRLDGVKQRPAAKEAGIPRVEMDALEQKAMRLMRVRFRELNKRGFNLADFAKEGADSIFGKVAEAGALAESSVNEEEVDAMMEALFAGFEGKSKIIDSTGKGRKRNGKKLPTKRIDTSNRVHMTQVTRTIQAEVDQNGFDMVYEYWIMNILSGPQTQVVNIVGNTANAFFEYAFQRPLEIAWNRILKGKDAAQVGEFAAMRKALPGLYSLAIKAAKEAWATEISFFEADHLNDPAEIESARGKLEMRKPAIKGAKGRIIRIPGRALLFADTFFKTVAGFIEVQAFAYRIGKREGLTGEALDEFMAGQLVAGSEAWQGAVGKAQELTFTKPLENWKNGGGALEAGAKLLMDARHSKSLGPYASFALGLFFPFVQTPFRIFQAGLRRTPLGLIGMMEFYTRGLVGMKQGTPFLETVSKARMARDLADQTIAWMTTAIIWGAAEGDPDDDDKFFLITGSHPYGVEGTSERDASQRINGGPFMIRMFGKRGQGTVFDYGRIEPLATTLAAIIDAIRGKKRIDSGVPVDEEMMNLFHYALAQTTEKTFLKGLASLYEFMENPGRKAGGVPKFLVAAIVPNIIRQPIRNLDSYGREYRTAPWYYHALPVGDFAAKKIDVFGNEVKKGDTPIKQWAEGTSLEEFFNAADPLIRLVWDVGYQQDDEVHPLDKAMRAFQAKNPGQEYWPSRNYLDRYRDPVTGELDKEMSREEFEFFQRLAGAEFSREGREAMLPIDLIAPNDDTVTKAKAARAGVFPRVRNQLFSGGVPPVIPNKPFSLKDKLGLK